MRSSSLLPLLAASYGVAQQLNTTYVTGLSNTLTGLGLTNLVSALTSLVSDPQGQGLVAQLPNGTKTIFAPNNDALSGGSSLTYDTIAYHILSGNLSTDNVAADPSHTIARTFLNDSSVVQLETNKSQVLGIDKASNGSLYVFNQPGPVYVLQTANYSNLMIYVIDTVLRYPDPLSVTIGNLSTFNSVANQAGVLPALEAAHGITIFAPNDQAFSNAQSALNGANSTVLTTVLGNHVINGTTVYSTELGNGKYTSGAGESFAFSSNSSGSYVTSGSSTARIVQSDVLVKNGVIHVIDTVLANTQSNPSAASSAYNAATSSAASAATSTQTGPVGHNAAPASIGVNPWSAVVVAIGVAAGAFFTL